MTTIGDRLRSERERLGLSQEAVAELLGLHRNTVARYESGKTQPPAGYLEVIRQHGGDLSYIVSGERSDPSLTIQPGTTPDDFQLAMLGQALLKLLGFSQNDLSHIALSATQVADRDSDGGVDARVRAYEEAFTLETSKLLEAKQSISRQVTQSLELDSDLLEAVLEQFDMASAQAGQTILPMKKAKAVAMLYRTFAASGQIDRKVIEQAVALAT